MTNVNSDVVTARLCRASGATTRGTRGSTGSRISSRSGQVTMFVIIGLVLLVVVGLVVMSVRQRAPTSAAAQEDTQLVSSIVQQCLEQVGEESVRQVAAQGGYADMSSLIDVESRDTQVVRFDPERIPMWHTIKTPRGQPAKLEDNRPSLCTGAGCPVADTRRQSDRPAATVQQSIKALIERNIDTCIANFSAAPNVIVERKGAPEVTVLIHENDVSLALKYPMVITTHDNQLVDVEDFRSSLDVRLPQMYRMATKIQGLERSNMFIEESFLHLLSIYARVGGPVPPYREIRLDGNDQTWARTDVQRTIEQDILPFLSFIQTPNALESYVPVESNETNTTYIPYADGVYRYMDITMGNETYPLGARFEYPGTPIYLDINGREYLAPRRMPGAWLMRLVGGSITDYRFRYTVTFPMVVHISDPEAFGGEGLEFQYALEANIKNNEAFNTSAVYQSVDDTQSGLDLGDISQRVDHTYAVRVVDRRTGVALRGARVTYSCGAEVAVGETDGTGIWSGRLPYCATGGAVIAAVDGYARAGTMQNNIDEDRGRSDVTVKLWPLQNKTVKLYKRTAADVVANTRSRLSTTDTVTVDMRRMGEIDVDEPIPTQPTLLFGGTPAANAVARNMDEFLDNLNESLEQGLITREQYNEVIAAAVDVTAVTAQPPASNAGTVEQLIVALVPGTYEIDGLLLYNNEIQIPSKRVGGFLGIGAQTLPPQNFTGWQSGGVLLAGQNAVVFNEADIYGPKNLTLFVLEDKIPATYDDLDRARDVPALMEYGGTEAARARFE